ncbi:MAG: MFS transporter [Lentisphaeria bacterium]|nr:MFS transporter [Lentisphaeria bacterium]
MLRPASSHRPAFWIPTLYFAEGVPAAVVTEISILIFHGLMMPDSSVAFWANFFGLPWILKPLWAPAVDLVRTKRFWIIMTQLAMALCILGTAAACGFGQIQALIITFLLLTAIASATHDIAADGFYILALSEHDQAIYSGLRSVFYRCAMLAANGALTIFAGIIFRLGYWGDGVETDSAGIGWGITLILPGLFFLGAALYHALLLPRSEQHAVSGKTENFGSIFLSFFRRKHIGIMLIFLLFYRFAEAQLGAASRLFLLSKDGLALSTLDYGFAVGTVGVIMLLAGGVAGGLLIARYGMGKMILPMFLAINLPDLVYVYLAFAKPDSLAVVSGCIALEQFGYGIGFTLYMLLMVWYAAGSGSFKTSHFALMTGFMILGLRLPGMVSGYLLEKLPQWFAFTGLDRYEIFFLWVIAAILPAGAATWLVARIADPDYGKAAR